MATLKVENLHVSVEGTEILKGINLEVNEGEVTVLMGPNGSGKSTLSNVLMGHPDYEITKGKITFHDKDITKLSPDKRAKLGIFLSFQYPSEITGVTLFNFLRTAYKSLKDEKISIMDFNDILKEKMNLLGFDEDFSQRYLNEGFSGGEKKKAEILQLSVLEPKLAILDETDSGLDIDALKIVSNGVNKALKENKMGVFLITHYQRILHYIKPDKVFILIDGKIAKKAGPEIVDELEEKGYDWLKEG